jgi:hypothetical protein
LRESRRGAALHAWVERAAEKVTSGAVDDTDDSPDRAGFYREPARARDEAARRHSLVKLGRPDRPRPGNRDDPQVWVTVGIGRVPGPALDAAIHRRGDDAFRSRDPIRPGAAEEGNAVANDAQRPRLPPAFRQRGPGCQHLAVEQDRVGAAMEVEPPGGVETAPSRPPRLGGEAIRDVANGLSRRMA